MAGMRRDKFIDAYVEALDGGSAGLFVGAGVSVGAGYPSWKELVKEMAEEVGLDVEREPDLAGVVQYYLNKAGKSRTLLAKVIAREIGVEKPIPELLRTLSRLPIRGVWTTNYDTLIERAWTEQRLRLDVKTENRQLTVDDPAAHGALYKMHGTVGDPSTVVIAKGDYEGYRRTRGEFLNLLRGHLVARHVLFVGFSFTDPNLSHLFGLIREVYEDTPRDHYAVVKPPQRRTYVGKGSKDRFDYDCRRHALVVQDLQNYGIHCVEVDAWSELDEIMEAVERKLAAKSVLISGSFPDALPPGTPDDKARIEAIARGVGQLLADQGYRFVSGFGLVVGSAALSGALEQIYKEPAPHLDRLLLLRPFPQVIPAGWNRQDYYRRYREDLIRQAGIGIFISGLKVEAGAPTVANGVIAEYEMLRTLKRTPVPIGATGGAAADVWKLVDRDYVEVFGRMPRQHFDGLNDAGGTPAMLVECVRAILAWLKKHG